MNNKAFILAVCKCSNPEHFGRCSLVRLLANLLAWLQPNHKYTAVQLRRGQDRLHFSIVCAFVLIEMGTRDDEYDYLFKGWYRIHLSRVYKLKRL